MSGDGGSSTSAPSPEAVPAGLLEHRRWLVHSGLIAVVVVVFATLTVTRNIPLHVLAGLVFAGLVLGHLGQRRRTLGRLAAALLRVRSWVTLRGRLAMSDAVLAFLAVNVVASGIIDWITGRNEPLPLPGRLFLSWHGASAVLFTGYLVVHVLRRRQRLRSSRIR